MLKKNQFFQAKSAKKNHLSDWFIFLKKLYRLENVFE